MAGRYVLDQQLGRGGMAVVHEALDAITKERLAIKRLWPRRQQDESASRGRELFEREYHMLAQLAHPRIVEVFDYGVDGEQPYYTMELLDGGDLLERSPLPWKTACSVARDICSALSLVHSRRMVYRDLSPRNVRCTSDGKAKLLDFGAMAPMGPVQVAVCTPPMAAPEVVYRQPLDGRSDLYALGATLYFTLVGRNAYPARGFRELPESWKMPPPLPSELVEGIPEALDALVMDLLQLEPHLRPASAAEVSERLSALAGLGSDELLLVSQAYLTTPTLVGRDAEMRVVQRTLRRLLGRRKGAALLVRGAPGVGRSRLLDACVLQAKLAGATVVRVIPAEDSGGAHGAARAIVEQLLENAPDDTIAAALPYRHALRDLLPALHAQLPEVEGQRLVSEHRSGQVVLRDFLLDLARRRPLVLAVDDLQRFDEESRALLALLARKARGEPLLALGTTTSEATGEGDVDRMLADACTQLGLQPLKPKQTQALLASIFGEVPNLALLVRRLQALAAGNPKDLMRLAQHLLDRQVVRYRGGGWVLPDRIDAADLPATLSQAYSAAVAALDEDARTLGSGFAQCPDQRFSIEECLALSAHGDHARTFRNLDLLVASSMLTFSAERYALANAAWATPLSQASDPQLHARLAEVFGRRGDGLRAVRHLLQMGNEREAVDVLVRFSEESHRKTAESSEAYIELLSSLPRDWIEIFSQGIALCQKHGRSARELFVVRNRLGSIFSQSSVCCEGHQAALAHSIARDAGLDIYASLPESLPHEERLERALFEAARRYAATPEHERVFDPKMAIAQLCRTTISAIGSFSRTLDVEEWAAMPSIAPLASVSPTVAVVDSLARGFEARLSGRFEHACEIYERTLQQLEQAEGLDRTFAESVRAGLLSIVGTLQAALGRPESARWADQVEHFPLYHASAMTIRMLDRLWQGDLPEATRLARERELLRLEQPRQQSSDVLSVLWMLQVHAASDDLTQTRHCLEIVERQANQLPTWQPIAAWARGEYQRIRGDRRAALSALDSALGGLRPGHHQIWPLAAAARLKVLCALERFEDALADGAQYLADAQKARLGYLVSYLRMPLAIAAAQRGRAVEARELAQAALQSFETLGARGINPGLAHETAARVASILGDQEDFEHHAEQCKRSFLAYNNPALATKVERLARLARRAQRQATRAGHPTATTATMARSHIETTLMACEGSQARLERALRLVVDASAAMGGYLYATRDGALALCARTLQEELPPELEAMARGYLAREIDDDVTMTTAADAVEWTVASASRNPERLHYQPVLLSHQGPAGFVISGLVVLAFDAEQSPRPTADAATHISRLMVDSGDLPAHLVG